MTAARELLVHLKPTDTEITRLAIEETDPSRVAKFEPITRGPVFALLALAVVGLAALPSCLFRIVRGVLRSRPTDT